MKKKLINLLLKLKHFEPAEMARYAETHTAFYADFYKDLNTANFESLPVLTKYHLIGVDPYTLLNRDYVNKVYLYGETSGSSGSPTPSFMTPRDFKGLIMLNALSPYATTIKHILRKNRTAVNGLTFGFTIAGFSFGALLQDNGALVAQLGSRSTIAIPERTAGTIAKLKPSIISATPLDFMTWMAIIRSDHAVEYNHVLDNIKMLISSAEPCATSRMRRIEEHFGIQHVNVYASVDGFVTLPCPCGEMHLIEHLHHIELYDQDMARVEAIGTGRLCFTNLIRKTTPMVRYLIDDLVTLKDSRCPYGFKRSIKPRGRFELSVEIKKRLWGNLDFEETIYNHGLFMDYKIEIHQDTLSIELEEYPEAKRSYDFFGLKKEIAQKTGMRCQIKILPFGELTDFRKVRKNKSVVKVLDCRETSKQEIPQVL